MADRPLLFVWNLIIAIIVPLTFQLVFKIYSHDVPITGSQAMTSSPSTASQVVDNVLPYHEIIFCIKSGGSKGQHRRRVLRNTVLPVLSKRVDNHYFFLMGDQETDEMNNQMQTEISQFNDIFYMPGVTDRYRLLGKKIYEGFRQVYDRYRFKWLVLMDDDTIINPYLLDMMKRERFKERLFFAGILNSKNPAVSWPGHPNHEPEYRDTSIFPPYISGPCVVLSFDLVEWVASSKLPLRILANDDAQLGVWLAAVDGARAQHLNGFTLHLHIVANNFTVDSLAPETFAIGNVPEENFGDVWQTIQRRMSATQAKK